MKLTISFEKYSEISNVNDAGRMLSNINLIVFFSQKHVLTVNVYKKKTEIINHHSINIISFQDQS